MTLVEQTAVLLRLRHAETYGAALAVLTGLYWGYGLWRMRRRTDGRREWGGPRAGRPAVRALFSGACLAFALGCLHLGVGAPGGGGDPAGGAGGGGPRPGRGGGGGAAAGRCARAAAWGCWCARTRGRCASWRTCACGR